MLKKLFIALLPLGTIAVMLWLVLPEYRLIQEEKAHRKEAEDALTQKQELIAKIRNLEEQYRSVEDVADKVASIVPTLPDIPNLLVEIPEIALQHGLTLDNLSFSVYEGQKFEGRSTTQGTMPFQAMEATLNVEGSFESLVAFLGGLQKELRIMDVQSLQFAVPEDISGGPAPLKFNMLVRMYYGLET